jgi:hypothetical protein
VKRKGDVGSSHFFTKIMSLVLKAKATLGCELLKSKYSPLELVVFIYK